MSVTVEQKSRTSAASDTTITLWNVDWTTYRRLREEPANGRLLLTYDQGMLHVMSPGRLHERIATLIERMVHAWSEQRDVALSSGALTVSREDLQRGCEPDRCYFIEHEAEVRESDNYSLDADDPPPDLVVEVDVASSSAPRMPIYAAMGVAEVWRWRNETLQVFRLGANEEYAPQEESQALPGFPVSVAAELLRQRRQQSELAIIKQFREADKRSAPPG